MRWEAGVFSVRTSRRGSEDAYREVRGWAKTAHERADCAAAKAVGCCVALLPLWYRPSSPARRLPGSPSFSARAWGHSSSAAGIRRPDPAGQWVPRRPEHI